MAEEAPEAVSATAPPLSMDVAAREPVVYTEAGRAGRPVEQASPGDPVGSAARTPEHSTVHFAGRCEGMVGGNAAWPCFRTLLRDSFSGFSTQRNYTRPSASA